MKILILLVLPPLKTQFVVIQFEMETTDMQQTELDHNQCILDEPIFIMIQLCWAEQQKGRLIMQMFFKSLQHLFNIKLI